MKTRKKSLILGLCVVFIDQLLKISMDTNLVLGKSVSVIENFFYLTKVYNYGAAWSIMGDMLNILIGISLIALVCLFYYQDTFKKNHRSLFGFGLIYGGLFGNLIDRLSRGYVVDFLHFQFGYYSFPVFNFADIALVIGFFIIIIAVIKGDDKYANKSRRKRHTN